MATAAAVYTRPSDNVAPNATITIQTGTDPGDANYGPASLVDLNPAKMAKILSTTGAWLFDFGAAQRLDVAGFIHGTFETACTLHWQGNATDSWGAPTFDAEVEVLPWYGSGATRWPRNQWVDLTEQEDYSPTGFRYWRLVCTGNTQNIQLGQVVLSPTLRTMHPDLQWEYIEAPRKRSIINETAYGSKTVYARTSTQRMLQGSQRMTEALYRSQRAHWYDADGVALPWLLCPSEPEDEGSPAWKAHGECYFVRWVEDTFASTHTFFDVRDRKFTVEELSRGLRPGV